MVEVTGFEPATFWSRKNEARPATSAFIHVCLIIPDRKATICFSFRFALHRIYGWPNTESTAIRFYPDGKFGMNHIFGFGLFDLPNVFTIDRQPAHYVEHILCQGHNSNKVAVVVIEFPRNFGIVGVFCRNNLFDNILVP